MGSILPWGNRIVFFVPDVRATVVQNGDGVHGVPELFIVIYDSVYSSLWNSEGREEQRREEKKMGDEVVIDNLSQPDAGTLKLTSPKCRGHVYFPKVGWDPG
jgi:hypothetical protein